MLQWHHQAVEPAGDARSDLWFTYHLGRRIRDEARRRPTDEMDRPVQDLTWDYPTKGAQDEPDAEAVLAEINGWDADGQPLSSYTQLTADGSTACGCWIYCGVYADGVNQAARRKPGREQNWVAPEWGWAWPANRRILYNRASADPDGKPWSERKALVWWDAGAGRVDRPRRPRTSSPTRPPSYRPPDGATGRGRDLRHRPVHHAGRRQGLAVRPGGPGGRPAARPLRAAGVAVPQPALRASSATRSGRSSPSRENRYQPSGTSPGPRCSRT